MKCTMISKHHNQQVMAVPHERTPAAAGVSGHCKDDTVNRYNIGIVLIHGAALGSFIWDDMKPLISNRKILSGILHDFINEIN
jgi:hypothetical protein